ncbi:hypothetical protein D6C97_03610 [Aureobasidium pullulans]|nr:hypothetical protein D6C97_03610 [Aureobasidium pullulans]THY99406.1 hypothetical protein D6C92_02350 [Aureobasidium pullulans]
MAYQRTSFYGYQQAVALSNNMSTLFEQDTKDYFFDLECPELTGSESSQSPTASSFTSGGSYTAPSPSADTKDLVLCENGVSVYSPISDLSPLSNFSDSCFNVDSSSTWSEQPIVPSCNPSSQYSPDLWSCSQYLPSQSLFDVTGRSTMPIQSHSEGSYASSIQGLFPMAMSHLPAEPTCSLEQTMPISFVDYGADGMVVPGHLFNTTLDRYSFTDPSPVTLPTQSIGDSTYLASAVDPIEAEVTPEPSQQTTRFAPEIARNTKDEYLQEARRRGLSYKEIKRRGGFTEAESTLRGRIRILSKPKEMRVRKPQWNRSDIMLLVEAVESFSEASQGSSSRKTNMRQKSNMSKLPWKKVAEWMLSHGASYPFAGATCAKKWEQIREMSL